MPGQTQTSRSVPQGRLNSLNRLNGLDLTIIRPFRANALLSNLKSGNSKLNSSSITQPRHHENAKKNTLLIHDCEKLLPRRLIPGDRSKLETFESESQRDSVLKAL
jgi:hypothetical protein